MQLSVELSMYPLEEQYGTPILAFIQKLQAADGVEVRTNTMSTQVFGPYELVMKLLEREMKIAFESDKTVVMVAKFVNEDLRP